MTATVTVVVFLLTLWLAIGLAAYYLPPGLLAVLTVAAVFYHFSGQRPEGRPLTGQDIVCPKCRREGLLLRYSDSEPHPGVPYAGYVLHEEPRRTCQLRRVDLEKGVPQKCI